MRIGILLLLATCSSPRAPSAGANGSAATPAPAPAPPPARWIHKTWIGPAIINAGPEITLCSDGRYQKSAPFRAPPDVSGMSVNDIGVACCDRVEHGTYELDRDPSGAVVAVRFTPTIARDGTAPYTSPITDGDHLEGYRATTPSRCDP